jgi:hypothetical protein
MKRVRFTEEQPIALSGSTRQVRRRPLWQTSTGFRSRTLQLEGHSTAPQLVERRGGWRWFRRLG